MASAAVVQVQGLRALARDLQRAGTSDSSAVLVQMREAGRSAAEPVADAVRGAYPFDSGRLSGSVRVTATRTGASVRVGRASIPYAGPVDFGGYPGDRQYVRDGRYLYPTARAMFSGVQDKYSAALEVGFNTYPWTNTTTNGESVHD